MVLRSGGKTQHTSKLITNGKTPNYSQSNGVSLFFIFLRILRMTINQMKYGLYDTIVDVNLFLSLASDVNQGRTFSSKT